MVVWGSRLGCLVFIFFGSSKTSLKGVGEKFFGTKNLKRACIISGQIIATENTPVFFYQI